MLGTYVLTNSGGTVLDKVIRVRNPWGKDSFNVDGTNTYNGKWNDGDSTNWNQVASAVKTACGYVNNVNDGVFFVS